MPTKDSSLCSICSLSYNHAFFIRQHMEGMFAQDYPNIEIIALDDGSSDSSVQVLKECQAKSPFPFQIIEQKNSGNVGGNFNTLLKQAKGKYVVMISCDDKLASNAISTKIELMEQDENMVFVASRNVYIINNNDEIIPDDHGWAELLKDTNSFTTAEELRNFEYEKTWVFWMQNAVFRKSVIEDIKGFDEDLMGDDIILRAKLFIYMIKNSELNFKIIPTTGLYYRLHDNNVSKQFIRSYKILWEVYGRYYRDKPFHSVLKDWLLYSMPGLPTRQIVSIFSFNHETMIFFLTDRSVRESFLWMLYIRHFRKYVPSPIRRFFRNILIKDKLLMSKEEINRNIEVKKGFEIRPLVSICSLSFNHEAFIRQHMESFFLQDYPNIEIIALDDGSSDKSLELLNSLKEESPFPLEVFEQINTGRIGYNFNQLLKKAKGKYIVFISCDDKLASDAISTKIALLEQDNNMVFVASKNHIIINKLDEITGEFSFKYSISQFKGPEDLRNYEYETGISFHTQNAVFRKSVVDAIDGFDEDLMGDDIVLHAKLFLYMIKDPKLTFKIIPTTGLYYRLHENNTHKDSYRMARLLLEFADRYYRDKPLSKSIKIDILKSLPNISFKQKFSIFFLNRKSIYLFFIEDKEILKLQIYTFYVIFFRKYIPSRIRKFFRNKK